jgi:hypothetical protein
MSKTMHWFVCALLAAASGTCLAQSISSGDIRGTVTDPSGALIPDVTVSVLNVDTGVTKDFTTNAAGLYDTNSIVPGHYVLTFKREGFEKLVRGPITLEVGFTTVNAEMKVGSAEVQVTVTSDIPLLDTETGQQQTTLDAKSMDELPQVTQDWENFVILLPGATGTPGSSAGSSNPGQVASVNGNLPYSNILADGASTTLSHSQNANPVTFENVAELQVNTSSFSAQYGIGGVLFNQISKGGTSSFHGTAYDFIQNDAFNAYAFQFGQKPQRQILHYNDYGASLGGPLLKGPLHNKAFFYFNFDKIVNNSSYPSTSSVPTAAIQSGDFTGLATLYDPTTQTIAHDAGGNPYPVRKTFMEEYGANQIPAALIDSVAARLQAFYPTTSNHIPNGNFVPPNGTGPRGEPIQNFTASVPSKNPWNKYFGRLDYDITTKNRLTLSDQQADIPAFYPNSVTACPVGCQTGDVDNNNAQITDAWNIRPNLVNEARIGYTAQLNFFVDLALRKGYASKVGWQFAKADDFPDINFVDGDWNTSWINHSTNSVYKEHVFDPSDVVTLISGKHILHFGAEVLIYRDNSTAWGNTEAGAMDFGSPGWGNNFDYTANWVLDGQGMAHIDSNTGWDYADFLLGYVNTWSASVTPEYGGRLKAPQFFIQDDFKITPTLTLNMGIRYQITHGWSEVHGNIDSFDPTVKNTDGTLGAMWYASTHANGRKDLQQDTDNTWLPRVGFSWLANAKTTLRGGFGMYAYNMSLDTYGGGMGAAFGASGQLQDNTFGITPVVKLDGSGNQITPITGVTSSTPVPYSSASTAPDRFNGQGVNGNQYKTPIPQIYQWNFAVQREVGSGMVAELSYVASHAKNLNFPMNLNQIPQSELLSSGVNKAAIPYPNFNSINWSTNNAISNYNSLQAQITKRMANGVSFNFNYVWSHFLDDQDSSGWGSRAGPQQYQNAYSPSANYGASNFDVRHAFKGYVVYELPFGKGKTLLNRGRALDAVVGGWQISGTTVLSTGNPFTVISNQNTNSNGSGGPYPNPSGKSWIVSGHNYKTWYDPAAFIRPSDGTYGTVRRNSLYGPGINVFNLSAHKQFELFEAWAHTFTMQFRVDTTNTFNHPSFSPPQNTLAGDAGPGTPYTSTSNGTGNQITSTTVGGRNVQFALRLSF